MLLASGIFRVPAFGLVAGSNLLISITPYIQNTSILKAPILIQTLYNGWEHGTYGTLMQAPDQLGVRTLTGCTVAWSHSTVLCLHRTGGVDRAAYSVQYQGRRAGF